MTRTNTDVSPAVRVGLGLLGIVQFALAGLAFWDLSHRRADEVKGPKPIWIPVILINWIGPLAYFFVHRNR